MFKKIDFTSYKTILVAALIFRLLSAIFSEGYGMHDDHFLIVEAASSWSDGYDYNNWLPWSPDSRGVPDGHSFTYVGINYLFFVVFKFLGITDPGVLMVFNRIFHALFSMLVVYFGIKITEKLAGRQNAVTVGWLLALLWIMPFLSVRNLVEMTSIPFLMWGVWLLVQEKNKNAFLYAGLLMGMAVSFRYQIGVFAVGIAAYYFFRWQWKRFLLFCAGVLVTFALTQGIVDYFIWGYPFAEFLGYVVYNMHEGTEYMANNNYFMYFYVLFGVLLVPLGILAAIGFFRSARKYWLLFLPVMLFILFHTVYPNRQERFVLTVFPLVVILTVIGFEGLKQKAFWKKSWRFGWISFWVLNIPLLLFFSFTSSKKSRVEAMYALYDQDTDYENILLEASGGESKVSMMPKFYAGSWYCGFTDRGDAAQSLEVKPGAKYDYIFFFGEEKLAQRVKEYQAIYPGMKCLKKCDPSSIDKLLHALNPRNSNEYIEVWRTYTKRN